MTRTSSLPVEKQKEMYDLYQQGLKPKDIAARTQVSLPTAYAYTRKFNRFKSFDEYMQHNLQSSYKPIVVRSEKDLQNPARIFMMHLMNEIGYVPTNSKGEIIIDVKEIFKRLSEHPKREEIYKTATSYLDDLLDESMMDDMF